MPTSSSAVSCCTHYLTASTASATTASSPMAPAITHPSSHSRVDEYVPILFIRIRYDRQQLLDPTPPCAVKMPSSARCACKALISWVR
jgi:hypothetical protein